MSARNFTTTAVPDKPAKTNKPAKPEGCPLFPHRAGYWAKKIRGKLHYFGERWHNDAEKAAALDGALDEYDRQKEALHAGRKPRPDTDALTVKDAANEFLNSKQELVDTGELSPRTWYDYKQVCDAIVSAFGKARLVTDLGPDDFAALRKKMAKRWGPQRLGSKLIQYTRSVFKHAFDSGLIASPVRFGPGFKRPSKKVLRLNRAEQGPKLFTAEEIRRLIDAAGTSLKAMLLLGINCGFGNADCGNLPLSAVDLDAAVIDFPRPKTGVPRRCVLWPETVAALRGALAKRHNPKRAEHAGLFFITLRGDTWGKDTSDNPISKEVAKLLKKLGINGRKGLGFYTLRHVFRTVADEAKDQPATDYMMGHESTHMSSLYRETISDTRLKAVADYVHDWLFPPKPELKKKGRKKAAPTKVAGAAPAGE